MTQTDERRKLLAAIHQGAKRLDLADDDRRVLQEQLTGRASARDMSLVQLRAVAWRLKDLGADLYVPGPRPKGGERLDRPTPAQLASIERAALELGMADGLEDRRLAGFVRHTAKVEDVRFMSRHQATQVLTALRRWAGQRAKNAAPASLPAQGRPDPGSRSGAGAGATGA